MKKSMSAGWVALLAALFMTLARGDVVIGGDYFTKVNLWYEHPEKIYSTNYHVGQILPVGTAVKVQNIGKNFIQFRNDKGLSFKLLYNAKHNPGGLSAYLDTVFSSENVLIGRDYRKFSKAEKDNISKGVVAEGMRKPAVIMAYGLPPSHKTSSTDSNSWIYWLNRFKSITVTFSDAGVVTHVSQ